MKPKPKGRSVRRPPLEPLTAQPSTPTAPTTAVPPTPVPDRQLADFLILGVPAVVLGALILEIVQPIALGRGYAPMDIIMLRGYALFLASYHTWIIGYEYTVFSSLHNLKSRPLDFLLIAGMFVSIYLLGKRPEQLSTCLASIVLFLAFLVVWEIYTMRAGYRGYFDAPHFRTARTEHWREYRYWLLLDGLLLAMFAVLWLRQNHIEAYATAATMRILGSCFGAVLGLVNVGRYRLLTRRIHLAATTGQTI